MLCHVSAKFDFKNPIGSIFAHATDLNLNIFCNLFANRHTFHIFLVFFYTFLLSSIFCGEERHFESSKTCQVFQSVKIGGHDYSADAECTFQVSVTEHFFVKCVVELSCF